MEYLERAPAAALADVATVLWGVRVVPPRRTERIFPTPALHLVVNGGGAYRTVDVARGTSTVVSRVFCSGLQTSALRNELPEAIDNIGVKLSPDAAGVLGLDARLLAGRVVEVGEQFPELARLGDELPGLSLETAISRLESALTRRRSGSPDAVARRFVEAVSEDPGRPVPELAALAEVSHDALISAVRAGIGVTPKAFADLVRFDRFVDLAGRAAEVGWAALAVEAGFYDQSHLIRVFRRFTGLTPAAYVRAVRQAGPQAARFLPE
ncbi:helix-turn-helix domain-containing protein [Microbacterium sp. RD1]|uniref:helix-turn-helix domain-containing protein n=1 Tax=Microbacterium sp. RD1 TaxID=3457313 RepID=UPI003FA5A384